MRPFSSLGHSRVLLEQAPGASGELPQAACVPPLMPQSSPCLTFPRHYHLRIPAPHAGSVHGIPAAQPGASPAARSTPWLLWLLLSAALGNPLPCSVRGQRGAGRSGVWWEHFLGAPAGLGLCPAPLCAVLRPP